jgi:hypothetical protein
MVMDGARCWSVEAKVFEVSIKGGETGVRIHEKSKYKRSSIFVRREELAWLVDALEKVAESDKSEIYWDHSRAGLPRIVTQKRSNRHGRFLSIEEFDGRRRNGSILIPEGRFGQGWARLMVELDGADSLLWEGRKSGEYKKEAEKPGWQRRSEASKLRICLEKDRLHGKGSSWQVTPEITLSDAASTEKAFCGMPATKTLGQVGRVPATEQFGEAICGGVGSAGLLGGAKPKDRWLQALLSPAPNAQGMVCLTQQGQWNQRRPENSEKDVSANSGVEALNGRSKSAGDGSVLWGQRDFRVEMQELKNFLTKLKEDVDKGIRKVEEVMGLSGFGGLNMGNEAGQKLGCVKAVGYDTLKPKKRKNTSKKKKKGKQQLTGPKPGVWRPSGDMGSLLTRSAREVRSFQVGESSGAGAARAEGDLGKKSTLPSILGKFEWARKAEAPAILSVRGSVAQAPAIQMPPAVGVSEEPQTTPAILSVRGSVAQAPAIQIPPAVGDSEELQTTPVESPASLGVMGSAVNGQIEESCSVQEAPVVISGSSDQPDKAGPLVVGHFEKTQLLPAGMPTTRSVLSGDFGDFQTEDCLSMPASLDVSAGARQPLLEGEEASMLVPWQSGNLFLDSGGLGCVVDGEPIPLEIGFGRDEGDGDVTLSRQSDSRGMELVPFADGVPISQNWLLAMDDGNSGGCQEGDKGLEIIMAFRQIVGVSCDGHIERLRAAFAHILAGKKKEVKKNRGGGQVGRKGTREILNLFTSINYDGGSGSVTRNRGKGRGNRFVL